MRHVELDWHGADIPARIEAELIGELLAPPSLAALEDFKRWKTQQVKQTKNRLASAALAMPAFDPDKRRKLIEAGNATPETRAKCKRDVCEGLVKRKLPLLDKEHLLAVEEIRDIHAAWASIGYASGRFEMRVDGGKRGGDPLDRIPERTARAYSRNYLPWLRELVNDPIEQVTPRLRRVYLCAPVFTIMIAVDNKGVNEAEKICGFPEDKGFGTIVLRIALERYLLCIQSKYLSRAMQSKALDKEAETLAFDRAA